MTRAILPYLLYIGNGDFNVTIFNESKLIPHPLHSSLRTTLGILHLDVISHNFRIEIMYKNSYAPEAILFKNITNEEIISTITLRGRSYKSVNGRELLLEFKNSNICCVLTLFNAKFKIESFNNGKYSLYGSYEKAKQIWDYKK